MKEILFIFLQCTWGIAQTLLSIPWGRMTYFEKLRKEKNLPYTACFVESWASKWGELATGEEAIWD